MSNPNCRSVIQFTNRMMMLDIGGEVTDMDTTKDNFKALICKEVIPEREDNIPKEPTNSCGNESHKLHFNILQSTNKLIYKDILQKPDRVWTPFGVMSMRRCDMKSKIKNVKIWWPAPKMTTW